MSLRSQNGRPRKVARTFLFIMALDWQCECQVCFLLPDTLGGRIGRVSPKIRNLQDQLRRSQYHHTTTYEFYEDS